ncbi:tRNA pseudouridine(55) synthase TruB [Cognatilysobacter terrigena]|uniref:tRNA pseudouridine(55) synthase TruB n=1 Tax=Cognatilysobacter terrigena TaxID=2488749 RepID=UPI00105B2286|nr:tRNA pseudouridine(55) synthase TruB [Lysobacter terrigena]
MKSRTRFRRLDGILLLDKPSGMSSNQALQRVRLLFRAEKAGHTGSLDPLATGLLPVCFGEATKIAGLLLGAHKAYETTARLGLTTDTDDADGVALRGRPVPALDDATIDAAMSSLRGRIRQRAPIYSALKQGGEPLYARARRGEAVEAPERDVDVASFQLTGRDGDELRLSVECGSGTYVRSLVRDLGESLGCGAHVTSLRRLWVDPFRTPRMWTLDALQALAAADEAALDASLISIEDGLAHRVRVDLDAEASRRFGYGQSVALPAGAAAPVANRSDAAASSAASHGDADLVVVAGTGARVLGLATIDGGRLRPQRLFSWASEPAA